MQVAHEAGEDRVARGVTGRPLIWKMDKRQIDEDLIRWYDEEVAESAGTALRPGAFEARFGPSYGFGDADAALSTDEPLAIDVAGRTINLQGRIDRIDWDDAHEQFRVIDYKTGKYHAYKDAIFRHGESLQLPIYLQAAAKMTGIPPEQGEAQYFYASSRGEFKRRAIAGDELIAHSTEFEQILTTVADGVDTGFFAPNPGKNGDHCMWCDYKDVCDARITRIMTAKSGDTRGDAYRALGEIP
jgi:CRISPR/Cas system-associated exonuclease Cas4 (RecB family)